VNGGLPVQVYAAGSLREALTEVARAQGGAVALTFGAAGLLRERIERGEPAQVFASADLRQPQRLAEQGGWTAPVVFTRNSLCALVAPSVHTSPAELLDTLLDPAVRVGTSTPLCDPSGDYAWTLFAQADAVHDGARAQLEAKALQLLRLGDATGPRRRVPDLPHQRHCRAGRMPLAPGRGLARGPARGGRLWGQLP
jgi:molybdate transport system substrate-binding protein